MSDDRLPERAAELREEGRMRRGRPFRLRWEDYVERCEEGRRGGRLEEEEDNRQGRVEKTIRCGGEEVVDSTLPLTKRERER